MSYNNKNQKVDQRMIPLPQYYNPSTDEFEVQQGNGGAPFVQLSGSYVRLSTEPMPTVADGVKDGDDLLLVDTKAVYIYYKGTWYQQ